MRYAAFVIVAVAIAATGFFVANMYSPDDGPDLARSKISANGTYQVSIEPEQEPVEQGPLHRWIATIATPDGTPVVDATIIVDGGMPAHGHGLPTVPKTENIGDGRYMIHGVRFNMGGLWEMRLSIIGPAERDEVIFNIML